MERLKRPTTGVAHIALPNALKKSTDSVICQLSTIYQEIESPPKVLTHCVNVVDEQYAVNKFFNQ